MAIGQFSGNLVYFPRFGLLCQEKSGNPGRNTWRAGQYSEDWLPSFKQWEEAWSDWEEQETRVLGVDVIKPGYAALRSLELWFQLFYVGRQKRGHFSIENSAKLFNG
jgi:hypothetical protein